MRDYFTKLLHKVLLGRKDTWYFTRLVSVVTLMLVLAAVFLKMCVYIYIYFFDELAWLFPTPGKQSLTVAGTQNVAYMRLVY